MSFRYTRLVSESLSFGKFDGTICSAGPLGEHEARVDALAFNNSCLQRGGEIQLRIFSLLDGLSERQSRAAHQLAYQFIYIDLGKRCASLTLVPSLLLSDLPEVLARVQEGLQ